MSARFGFTRGALLAAAASLSVLAAPRMAAAQSSYDNGPGAYDNQGGTYYDPCARSQANRSVVGGVLGALAGATLGNSVTHGGAKVGGAIIGGVAGAAAGASIGHATAACQPGQTYYGDSAGYAPPPPPPPPDAYVRNDEDRYAAPPPPDYREPPRERCQMVEDRIIFPDGTTDSSSVQACQDYDGRWHVADSRAPGRD